MQLNPHQIIHRLEFALKNSQPVESLLRKANEIEWHRCPEHIAEKYNELSAQINPFLIH